MESNNYVGKEEIEKVIEVLEYGEMLAGFRGYGLKHPNRTQFKEAIEILKSQPLSPQSAKGVEEKKVDKNSMRLILKKHQVLEVIDDSFVHGTFPIEFIIAAITEYSSILLKEKDREIEGLNNVISKLFADKVSETRELQQTLKEKDEKIEELKGLLKGEEKLRKSLN